MNPRVKFHRILPEAVDFLPEKVVHYLDKAAQHPPACDIDASQALALAKIGLAQIYLVLFQNNLSGAFCVILDPEQSVLDVALLGGDMMKWRSDVWDFLLGLMQENSLTKMSVTGRKGMGKVFPELKPIGIVYEYLLQKGA